MAADAGLTAESLFAGRMGQLLADVAPYLVDFPLRSAFRDWWFKKWGTSVGVLVETEAHASEVRRHFRTLMIVRGQDRARYYFRFYDPRVLRAFLPACTPEEARRFFGPVAAFHCEGAAADEFLTFTPSDQGVNVQSRRLADGASWPR